MKTEMTHEEMQAKLEYLAGQIFALEGIVASISSALSKDQREAISKRLNVRARPTDTDVRKGWDATTSIYGREAR